MPPSAVPGARVRWGIGDVIAAFVVGLVVSVVAAAFVVDPDHPNDPTTLIVLICAQNVAIIAWLALVARRKGIGSLARRLRPADPAAGGGLAHRRAVVLRRRSASSWSR